MKWDELKTNWQAHTPDIDMPETKADMIKRVQQHAIRFERRIRMRDWLETIAALIITFFFGFIFLLPETGSLSRIGILVVLASCAFITWRLHSVRTRYSHEPDCTVTDILRAEIIRLDDQIQLLESVLWWYLVPLGTGVILIVLGTDGWSWFSLFYAVAVVTLYAGIYHLNQRAVQKELQPRRRELATMLESIISTEQPSDQGSMDTQ